MAFSPDNYDLSKLPKVAVEYLLKNVEAARDRQKKEIEGKKPQQERSFKTTNYRDDLDAWQESLDNVDAWFGAISAALKKRLAELTNREKPTDGSKDAAQKFADRDDHDFTVFHQTLDDAAKRARWKKFKIKVWVDSDGKVSIGDNGAGVLLGKCDIDKSEYYPELNGGKASLSRQLLHFVDRKVAELQGVELAPPTTAQGALDKYEREQRIVLGKDKADEDAQFHDKIAKIERDGQDVLIKYNYDRDDLKLHGTEEEKNKVVATATIDRLAENPPLMKAIETTEFFEALFPDRGGTPFFSDSYIKEQEKHFKKEAGKAAARNIVDILKRYNILARCFNTQGKNAAPPPIKYRRIGDGTSTLAGFFSPDSHSVTLNSWHKSRSVTTTAHELGHWYEKDIAGDEQVQEDWKWLKNLGGITDDNLKESLDKATITEHGVKKIFIRYLRRTDAPHFVRLDGYSSRIYTKKDDKTAIVATDLTSTSLEYFLTNPLKLQPSPMSRGSHAPILMTA